MWKKVAIAAGATAAVLGAGGAALALDTGGTSTPSASSGAPTATATAAAPQRHPGLLRLARRAVHGQWVTRASDGTFVTHDAIKGRVQSVSPTSITIAAADGFHQTYRITADTKVHIRENGKGTQATIGQVKSGQGAVVVGVESKGVPAARLIVVRIK